MGLPGRMAFGPVMRQRRVSDDPPGGGLGEKDERVSNWRMVAVGLIIAAALAVGIVIALSPPHIEAVATSAVFALSCVAGSIATGARAGLAWLHGRKWLALCFGLIAAMLLAMILPAVQAFLELLVEARG